MPFYQRKVDKKGYIRDIPTSSKPKGYLALISPRKVDNVRRQFHR